MKPKYINNANFLKKEMHVKFFQIMDRVAMKWGNFVQKGCNVSLTKTLSLTGTASSMEVGGFTNYVYLASYYLSDSLQIATKFFRLHITLKGAQDQEINIRGKEIAV